MNLLLIKWIRIYTTLAQITFIPEYAYQGVTVFIMFGEIFIIFFIFVKGFYFSGEKKIIFGEKLLILV